MSRRDASMERAYFDALYAGDADPWRFATSAYERDKYAASLAALPARRFASALEVGCSIGVFTQQLAPRCDRLLAIDVADAALAEARARVALPEVQFANCRVPDEWPVSGMVPPFDLIVLSETLYYLTEADIGRAAAQLCRVSAAGGLVLLVHFLGETDYPVSGDQAAGIFMRRSGLALVSQMRAPLYRIDLLANAGAAGPHLS